MSEEKEIIPKIAECLRRAQSQLIVTGAGVSVESGLPTYRGIGGLYHNRKTPDGMPIEEALNGEMMRMRPEVTWKYLWEIAEVCRGANPNRCHEIISKLEQHVAETWVLTQNVDGLHVKAGSQRVIEIHGRAEILHCTNCSFITEGESFLFDGSYSAPEVPLCPDCQAPLRPQVVLFDETLPNKAVATLEKLAQDGVDLVMSVGTSSLFPYITAPMQLASMAGIPTVEINLEETSATPYAQHVLRMEVGEAMEAIWNALHQE